MKRKWQRRDKQGGSRRDSFPGLLGCGVCVCVCVCACALQCMGGGGVLRKMRVSGEVLTVENEMDTPVQLFSQQPKGLVFFFFLSLLAQCKAHDLGWEPGSIAFLSFGLC